MRTTQTAFEYSATPVARRIVLKGVTANREVKLPGGADVKRFYFWNRTANAVTGGIRVGSAAAGTQYVTAQAIAANGLYRTEATVQAPIVQTAKSLFIEAVTAWNSASVDIIVEYDELTAPTLTETVNGVQLYDPLGRH